MNVRMYAMQNVESVKLEYDTEKKLFTVTAPIFERVIIDPRDAWVEYSIALANYVLRNIDQKVKAKEDIDEPFRTGRANSAI